MANKHDLFEALKKALRQEGLTYADVAKKLNLSEVSIKRGFSNKNFTLDRLESICALMGMDISSLVQIADNELNKISTLTREQEQEIVDDPKFTLVAVCAQNCWQMDEIVSYYDITEPECIRYLIKLERSGLIKLLPNNHIRRMLAHDFRWIPGGPIEQFYHQHIQSDFVGSNFQGEDELRIYQIGSITRESLKNIMNKMQMITREFAVLQLEDSKHPVSERHNTGLLLSVRFWESEAFASLKRK